MICAKGKTSIGRSTESCGSWARRLAIKRGQCSKNPVDSVERAVQAARELKADDTTVGSGTDTIDPDSVLNPKEIQVLLREANPGFERTLFETAYLTGARGRCSRYAGPISTCRRKVPAEWQSAEVFHGLGYRARRFAHATTHLKPSRPPNDLDSRSPGCGAQALETSMPDLSGRAGISRRRRKADAAGQDAPDRILPGPFKSETATRHVPHAAS